MKILQISTQVFTVFPKGYGGLEGVVGDLSIELLKLGHQVAIVAPKGSDVPGAEMIMPCEASRINDEAGAYAAYKDRLPEFDIIHNHAWAAHAYLAKMDNPSLRIMDTIHSMQPWSDPPPVKYPCLVGASKYHAQLLSGIYGVHVEVVYHGINLDTYLPKIPDKPLTERFIVPIAERKYLLYVARIAPFKGAHEFIALCHKLKVPGIVVGEDQYVDDKKYVRRVMDSCDGKRVQYLGPVPRGSEQMVELMQNAKAVIAPLLPPYGEIFGLSTIETMAAGTPFISTDRGAAKELIIEGKTGFVVPSVNELEGAIQKVDTINPVDCIAHAKVFDRSVMAKAYSALYEKMLGGEPW